MDERSGCLISSLRSAGPFLCQLLLAYPVTILVASPISLFVSNLTQSAGHQPPGYRDFSSFALLGLGIGAGVGAITGSLRPTLIPSGRIVWILPFLFFLSEAIPYLTGTGMYQYWFPEYLFVRAENEGLAVAACTLPACSVTGYSLGMAVAKRMMRRFRRGA